MTKKVLFLTTLSIGKAIQKMKPLGSQSTILTMLERNLQPLKKSGRKSKKKKRRIRRKIKIVIRKRKRRNKNRKKEKNREINKGRDRGF